MSGAVTILEKLLDDQSVSSKEHVLDTASRHVSNVEERFVKSYDTLVREITANWGLPQFNNTVEDNTPDEPEEEETPQEQQESTGGLSQTESGIRKRKKLKNVVPPWAKGIASSGGDVQAIRLCYWKRPTCVGYVVLRKEVDKQRGIALHYSIVLGARRRGPEISKNVQHLRQAKGHWFTPILNWLAAAELFAQASPY